VRSDAPWQAPDTVMSMDFPIRITFRNLDDSPAVRERVYQLMSRLERYFPLILDCQVVVDVPHPHHRRTFRIRINLLVPGEELVISHGGGEGDRRDEDILFTLRAAFVKLRRRLHDFVRRQREHVTHAPTSAGFPA